MNMIFTKITVQLLGLVFLAGVQKVGGNYLPREVTELTELECSHEMNLECNHPHKSTSNGLLAAEPMKPTYDLHNIAPEKGVGSSPTAQDLEKTGRFIRSAPGKEVWELYLNTRDKIKKWRSDYLEKSVTQEHAQEMDKKLNDSINAIKNLVIKRFQQLENIGYEQSPVLNEDAVLYIFGKVDPEWISSFADFGNIRKILELSTLNTEYQSLIRCLSHIALHFLVDSINLGIISEQSIRDFLKKTNGSFISDYIIDHFDPTDLEFRIYMFDLKLSLNEAPFFQKLSEISKFLDHEGWEKIEFRFLEMQINSDLETIEEGQLEENVKVFIERAKNFVQRISPEKKSPESQAVLEELLELIASKYRAIDSIEWYEEMTSLKVLYDTLRFIMRYQSKNTSTKFLEDYQKTGAFQKVRWFEEKIGVYYSLSHAVHIRSYGALHHIKKEIPGQTQLNKEISKLKQNHRIVLCNLVDSNQNRQISNFMIVNNQEKFPLDAESSNHQDMPLTVIPRYLHSEASRIINSDNKLIDQIKRYTDQQNLAGESGNITVLKKEMTIQLEESESFDAWIIKHYKNLFDIE